MSAFVVKMVLFMTLFLFLRLLTPTCGHVQANTSTIRELATTMVYLPVNYYPSYSYANGFTLSKGNLVGVVYLPSVYTVSFELFIPSYGNSQWPNVIVLSATNMDNSEEGSRLPLVELCTASWCSEGVLAASYRISSTAMPFVAPPNPTPLQTWTLVQISIDTNLETLAFYTGDDVQKTSLSGITKTVWSNVMVYASFPWNVGAIAKIRNLAIVEKESLPFRFYFNNCPGFKLFQGYFVGLVSLPGQFTVSFNLLPKAVGSGWRNIIRFAAVPGNGVGSRLPALFFCDATASDAIAASCPSLGLQATNWAQADTGAIYANKALPLNMYSKVVITVDYYSGIMTMTVSEGVTIPIRSVAFPAPTFSLDQWPSVRVYASDSFSNYADANMCNLLISSGLPAPKPTTQPTQNSAYFVPCSSNCPLSAPAPKCGFFQTCGNGCYCGTAPGVPSLFPTRTPTPIPTQTQKPIISPTPRPSSVPPTQRPSISPIQRPSISPTQRPIIGPTPQPPTQKPINTPSTAPTLFPTEIPGQPTSAPTPVPTRPTPEPTFQPTFLVCPTEQYANPQGDSCEYCPSGMTTNGVTGSVSINSCLCPGGMYRSVPPLYSCLSCPAGMSSNMGALSSNDCVNIALNFGLALVAVCSSVVMGYVYVYLGRYHRIAFVRREKVVLTQLYEFQQLASAISEAQEIEKHDRYAPSNQKGSCCHWLSVILFYILSALIIPLVIIVTYALQMTSILVDVLILFRGLRLKVPFLEFISHVLSTLGPLFETLFVPLKVVISWLAFFKIDLSAIQVTCPGSTAPVNLLIDLIVLGAVVIVVGSDYQLIRSVTLPSLLNKSVDIFVSKQKFTGALWAVVGLVSAYALDYQLILRLLMSLVRFDFWSKMNTSLDNSNACDKVQGLEKIDSTIASLVFITAGGIAIPLFYLLGRLVVQSLPPFDFLKTVVISNEIRDEIKDIAKRLEENARKRRKHLTKIKANRRKFSIYDVAMWFPSFVAPDLWLGKLTLAFFRRLEIFIQRANPGIRAVKVSAAGTWSREADEILRFFPKMHKDGVIMSVLCPGRDYADLSYVYNPDDHTQQRFESTPSFVQYDQWLEHFRSNVTNEPEPKQFIQMAEFHAKIDFKRWICHRRFSQPPSFNELVLLFINHFQHSKQRLTGGLKPFASIFYQILGNFRVFVTSCLGWWSVKTGDYYGVAESMDIFSLNALDASNRRSVGIGEHWDEYTKAWTAVIGPRAILFQIVPVLTPLMTYTKIMAASPLWVTDTEVCIPGLLDVNSFFRKARREVYDRENSINADESDDDKEWMVRLTAWSSYGTSSRLAKLISNIATLVVVFGLVTSGGLSLDYVSVSADDAQRILLIVSMFTGGIVGFFYSLKTVVLLGKMLRITDSDLCVSAELRKKNDERCKTYDEMAIEFERRFHSKSSKRISGLAKTKTKTKTKSHGMVDSSLCECMQFSLQTNCECFLPAKKNCDFDDASVEMTAYDSIPDSLRDSIPVAVDGEFGASFDGKNALDDFSPMQQHASSFHTSADTRQHQERDKQWQVNPLVTNHGVQKGARLDPSSDPSANNSDRSGHQRAGEKPRESCEGRVSAQLEKFYAVHNPAKVDEIPRLINEWRTRNPGRPLDEMRTEVELTYFYRDHNPAKVDEIPRLINEWRTRNPGRPLDEMMKDVQCVYADPRTRRNLHHDDHYRSLHDEVQHQHQHQHQNQPPALRPPLSYDEDQHHHQHQHQHQPRPPALRPPLSYDEDQHQHQHQHRFGQTQDRRRTGNEQLQEAVFNISHGSSGGGAGRRFVLASPSQNHVPRGSSSSSSGSSSSEGGRRIGPATDQQRQNHANEHSYPPRGPPPLQRDQGRGNGRGHR